MSHSTVLVIGEAPEKQLAPFDENIEMERYVEYTKEQLIAKERKEIESYRDGIYAKYLADPVAYKASTSNPNHLRYLETEFPEKLKWTDEQIYADAIKYKEKDELGPNGECYSTYNPQSKWDWYSLGGRWAGFFILKPGGEGIQGHHRAKDFAALEGEVIDDLPPERVDQAYKRDIDWDTMAREIEKERGEYWDKEMAKPEDNRFIWDDKATRNMTRDEYINRPGKIVTFAVLKDGQWFERGDMGWFGSVSDEKDPEEWEREWLKLVDELPDDTFLSVYDVHI